MPHRPPLVRPQSLRATGLLVLCAVALPAAAAGDPLDWKAPPTNGSPGVEVPKLSGHELLGNSTFDGKSIPWMTVFSSPASGATAVKDGQLCFTVTNKGVNPWDAQARHREMIVEKGHSYTISSWPTPPNRCS